MLFSIVDGFEIQSAGRLLLQGKEVMLYGTWTGCPVLGNEILDQWVTEESYGGWARNPLSHAKPLRDGGGRSLEFSDKAEHWDRPERKAKEALQSNHRSKDSVGTGEAPRAIDSFGGFHWTIILLFMHKSSYFESIPRYDEFLSFMSFLDKMVVVFTVPIREMHSWQENCPTLMLYPFIGRPRAVWPRFSKKSSGRFHFDSDWVMHIPFSSGISGPTQTRRCLFKNLELKAHRDMGTLCPRSLSHFPPKRLRPHPKRGFLTRYYQQICKAGHYQKGTPEKGSGKGVENVPDPGWQQNFRIFSK